jgi:AraC family transcriptional regulator
LQDRTLLINPDAALLGSTNAVLWGRGRRQYHVREFPGPLSIKAMVHGSAEWRIGAKSFYVDRDTFLIVDAGQPYSITVDAPSAVETFCVFFERGYVEDLYRTLTRPEMQLLEDPFLERLPVVGFTERLHAAGSAVQLLLRALYGKVRAEEPTETLMIGLAETLVHLHAEVPKLIARLPARRASTREELYRRVFAGRQWLDENLFLAPRLPDAAKAACLSPFHFQRLFCAVFHESPQQYVTRRRLESAARLLTETDDPVTMVCLDSGFESLGSFSTLFRTTFGFSPRAYRQEFARSKKFWAAG